MAFFSILESIFFLSLAILFMLVLLLIDHFKKKVDTLERNNELMSDICKTIIKELEELKTARSTQMFLPTQNYMYSNSFPILQEDVDAELQQVAETLFKNISYAPSTMKVLSETTNDIFDVEEVEDTDELEEIDTDPLSDMDEMPDSLISSSPDVNSASSIEIHSAEHFKHPKPWSKSSLQKIPIQMLRTMLIKDGICTDTEKLKKNEIIQMLLDNKQDDIL